MTMLYLGLAVFTLPHLFRRLMPGARGALGDPAKLMVTLTSLAGLVLMVLGYRAAVQVPVYQPLPGMGHANNLLMLGSVYLFGVGGTKGLLYTRLRHPMLLGAAVWAIAHLLVNGDMASLVLFGGILIWTLAEIALINRAAPWVVPTNGRGLKGDAMNLVGTALLFAAIAWVHLWLGYSPFLGTYG